MKKMLTAGLLALACILPTSAAGGETGGQPPQVIVNGVAMTAEEGWIIDGTSYVTLRGLDRVLEGTSLHWDGTSAYFSRDDFTLIAQPGQQYIEINDRALYLPQGVWVPDGVTALPIRLIAQALEGTADWDGDLGCAQLTTGVLSPWVQRYDQGDLNWLAAIISAESRGEGLTGQIAVGNVVLNRVSHWRYPDNIYGVIFDQNYGVQFEPVSNGTIYNAPTDQCIIAAKLVLEGADVAGDCLYFFAPALSEGTWIRENTQYVMTIGCHQFYQDFII